MEKQFKILRVGKLQAEGKHIVGFDSCSLTKDGQISISYLVDDNTPIDEKLKWLHIWVNLYDKEYSTTFGMELYNWINNQMTSARYTSD